MIFSAVAFGCFCFLPPFFAANGGHFDLIFSVLLSVSWSPVSVLFFSGSLLAVFVFAPILPALAGFWTCFDVFELIFKCLQSVAARFVVCSACHRVVVFLWAVIGDGFAVFRVVLAVLRGFWSCFQGLFLLFFFVCFLGLFSGFFFWFSGVFSGCFFASPKPLKSLWGKDLRRFWC